VPSAHDLGVKGDSVEHNQSPPDFGSYPRAARRRLGYNAFMTIAERWKFCAVIVSPVLPVCRSENMYDCATLRKESLREYDGSTRPMKFAREVLECFNSVGAIHHTIKTDGDDHFVTAARFKCRGTTMIL
jgi:hypothetical protein